MTEEAPSSTVASGEEVGWLTQYDAAYARDPDYIAEGLALSVTEEALGLMEQKNISRSQLAARMNVSRAYVTRLFNAPPNLTLRSIAQLAVAIGATPHLSLSFCELAVAVADSPAVVTPNHRPQSPSAP